MGAANDGRGHMGRSPLLHGPVGMFFNGRSAAACNKTSVWYRRSANASFIASPRRRAHVGWIQDSQVGRVGISVAFAHAEPP